MNYGLKNTHFETPHGLDSENHYTTAYELALLSNYAMKNKIFAEIVNTTNYTVTINGYPQSIHNTNELLGYLNGVYGIKTGFTNGANRCLVSCCKRNNLDIICVVLGADTKNFRTKDSTKLIEYTYKNFEPTNIEDIMKKEFLKWKETSPYFYIEKGTANTVSLEMKTPENSTIPINKEDISNLKTHIDYTQYLISPIPNGTVIGSITLQIGDKIISKCDIISQETIRKKTVQDYLLLFMKTYKERLETIS